MQWAPYLRVSAGHLDCVQLKFALMSSWTCVPNNVYIQTYEYTEYAPVLLMIKTGADKMMPDFYKHTHHFNMIHGERLLMHHWVRRWGESMEEGHFVSTALWWLDWMCSSHRWRPCIHWQLPQISEVFPCVQAADEGKPTVLFLCVSLRATKLNYFTKPAAVSLFESVSHPELKRSHQTLWMVHDRFHVLKEETGHRLIFSFIFQIKV